MGRPSLVTIPCASRLPPDSLNSGPTEAGQPPFGDSSVIGVTARLRPIREESTSISDGKLRRTQVMLLKILAGGAIVLFFV